MTTMGDGFRSEMLSLDEIFHQGVVAPSSRVLTTPSSDLQERVALLAKSFPLDEVMEDLGGVLARQFATEIESYGLRPSDFSHLDLASVIASRVAAKIGKSKRFATGFQVQIQRRG